MVGIYMPGPVWAESDEEIRGAAASLKPKTPPGQIGALTSILGITASYFWDLPTGATVVCTFGLVLLVVAALKMILPA